MIRPDSVKVSLLTPDSAGVARFLDQSAERPPQDVRDDSYDDEADDDFHPVEIAEIIPYVD